MEELLKFWVLIRMLEHLASGSVYTVLGLTAFCIRPQRLLRQHDARWMTAQIVRVGIVVSENNIAFHFLPLTFSDAIGRLSPPTYRLRSS